MPSFPFSLAQLSHFVVAARVGTLTRAAEGCGVSQPALSSSVRRLEQLLATELFFRHAGAGLELTDSGRALLPLAEDLLAAAERIDDFAAERRGGSRRVGCIASVYPFVVPLMQADDRRSPGDGPRRLEPIVAKEDALRQMVSDGRIDIWIGMSSEPDPAPASGTEFHCAISLSPYVIGSARTLRGHANPIRLRDVARHRICVLEEPASVKYVSRLFREHRQVVPPLVKLQTWESLRSVVAAGPDLSILSIPAPPVSISGIELELRRIADSVPDIHLGVFVHAGRSSEAEVHRVRDLCRRAMLAGLAAIRQPRVG